MSHGNMVGGGSSKVGDGIVTGLGQLGPGRSQGGRSYMVIVEGEEEDKGGGGRSELQIGRK